MRQAERAERAEVHDEHRHAGGDDDGDGEPLSLDFPKVTKQLPIDRPHRPLPDELVGTDLVVDGTFGGDLSIRERDDPIRHILNALTIADLMMNDILQT